MLRTRITMLTVLGRPASWEPPPLLADGAPIVPTVSNLSEFVPPYLTEQWCNVGRRRPRIVVLGTSPTSGCGACFGFDYPVVRTALANSSARRQSCELAGQATCLISHSWSSQLSRLLRESAGIFAHVEVWFKNAVGPNYFARCTSKYVHADTQLVLLEVATNVWGGSPADLVRAIRRTAPQAAIVFVLWPTLDSVIGPWSEQLLVQVSIDEDVDLLRVDRMLQHMPLPKYAYYVRNGRDQVHPNVLGHELLANATARFVASRIDSSRHCSAGNGTHRTKPRALFGWWEHCFTDARALPVPTSNLTQWRLVDEGDAKKGVQKWGLVSEALGSELAIGPLPGPGRGRPCEPLQIDLGYHARRSSATWQQGAFTLRCTGCYCAASASPHRFSIAPFPLVQTDTALTSEEGLRRTISVTATTSFDLLQSAGTDCWLHIKHVPSSANQTGWVRGTVLSDDAVARSRVRIDSVALSSKSDLEHAAKMYVNRFTYKSGYRFVEQEIKCDADRFKKACIQKEASGLLTTEEMRFCTRMPLVAVAFDASAVARAASSLWNLSAVAAMRKMALE